MRHSVLCLGCFLTLGLCAIACAQQPAAQDGGRGRISLPPPKTDGAVSVEAAIQARRSIRRFTDEALTIEQIGQLAWAAQGITERSRGLRATPSAGATYPLDVYMVTAEGVYSYEPAEHALVAHRSGDLREPLARAALGQGSVRAAPLVIVVTAVYERTTGRYGDRAERYVHIEVGHLGQNVHLQAVAMGLGSVPVGAFDPAAIAECLNLPPERVPLYLIPVGHPL